MDKLYNDTINMANTKLAELSDGMTKEAISPAYVMGKLKNQAMVGGQKLKTLVSAGMPKAQATKFIDSVGAGAATAKGGAGTRMDGILKRMADRTGKMDPNSVQTSKLKKGVDRAKEITDGAFQSSSDGSLSRTALNDSLANTNTSVLKAQGKYTGMNSAVAEGPYPHSGMFNPEAMPNASFGNVANKDNAMFNNVGLPAEASAEMYNNPVVDAIRARRGNAAKAAPKVAPKTPPAAQPAAQPNMQPAAQPNMQPAAQPNMQPAGQALAMPATANNGWLSRMFGWGQ